MSPASCDPHSVKFLPAAHHQQIDAKIWTCPLAESRCGGHSSRLAWPAATLALGVHAELFRARRKDERLPLIGQLAGKGSRVKVGASV
jgi:hypothetical protein